MKTTNKRSGGFSRLTHLWLPILFILVSILACRLPVNNQDGPFIFPTPAAPLFPSRTPPPDAATPIPAATLIPTSTPRVWPPPYFGSPGPTQVTPVPSPAPVFTNTQDINILLIGSDRRTTSSRTDTLIIANIQPQHNLVTLISIPRDLFVYIPGWKMQRINTAYQHGISENYPGGGPALLKDTILYNLGIEIDYWALVDFQGFEKIINTLGGIDVPVFCAYRDWRLIEPDLNPQDEDNWELFTLGPGLVHMDGELALWYARSRLKSSDFDRGRRQQEVLRAIYNQGMRANALARLPQLYQAVIDTISTDISLNDVTSFASLLANLDSASIRSYYINQNFVTGWRSPQGASLLIPRTDRIMTMLSRALSPPAQHEGLRLSTLVELWNGTETPSFETLAQERLNYAGYHTITARADLSTYTSSILYDFNLQPDIEQRQALLAILGLPNIQIIHTPNPASPANYRLILGTDYDPCFNPAGITR